MKDLASDISELNRTLQTLLADKKVLADNLVTLNNQLANAKFGKRGGIRQAIKNLEQQIRKNEVTIRKTQENMSELTLAQQGIDQDSSKIKASADVLQAGANLAGSIMGAGGLSGMVESKQQTISEIAVSENESKAVIAQSENKKDSSKMLMLVGGAVVLFMLMRKK